jgi:hypothetical protein
MAAENIVEGRPQPDDPSAQVKSGDLERQNCVVDGMVGRRP